MTRRSSSLIACGVVGWFIPDVFDFNWWQIIVAVLVIGVGIELIERLVWDVLPGDKGKK